MFLSDVDIFANINVCVFVCVLEHAICTMTYVMEIMVSIVLSCIKWSLLELC